MLENKKWVSKAIVLAVPTIAVFVLVLVFTLNGFASVCLAGCAFTYAWLLEALAYGLIVKQDFTPKAWQIRIYQAIITGMWTWATLSATTWCISLALSVFVGSLIMYVGVKYDDKDENGVPDLLDKVVALGQKLKKKVAEKKEQTEAEAKADVELLKYKPIDDILGNADDLGRPMCYYNGEAHSLNEAINDGQEEEAQKALDYIETLTKKEKDE